MQQLQGADNDENPEIPKMEELANFHNLHLKQPDNLDKMLLLVTKAIQARKNRMKDNHTKNAKKQHISQEMASQSNVASTSTRALRTPNKNSRINKRKGKYQKSFRIRTTNDDSNYFANFQS
jgi:hypothetical protein